ncbi:LysR family transcriptional regulator [Companilactobacillus jidongensis]|uniref:LysR family transcriptional regulator n=1 Tax=Companilactobacillus jidongensis TaxID=2486006 RepID=UPI0013DE1F93|nr:LysR family transcriptional regulator [Companilactobacillus jidongensis]
MEIRQLITFRTIVDTGSYTKTAELLGYTQSAVSAQVKELENELSAKLFDYSHRKIILLDAAKRLIPLTEQLLDDYQAIQKISQTDTLSGTLNIAAPESLTIYKLPKIISAFKNSYPDVQLQITNASCKFNQKKLIDGEADVAFMMWPEIHSTVLVDYDLGLQDMVCVVSGADKKDYDDIDFVSKFPFVINEPDCSYRNQFERTLWSEFHLRPDIMELWSIGAIKNVVASGVGYSYLPKVTVEQELSDGRLREINFPIKNEIHAHMLMRKNSRKQKLVESFVRETLK